MLKEESKRRQDALKRYLLEMSTECYDDQKDSSKLYIMAKNLKALYTKSFRHSYSEFFPLITKEMAGENSKYNLEYLSNNLESLRQYVEEDHTTRKHEFGKLFPHLTKLSDHINLEIARYQYYCQNERKIEDLEIRLKSTSIELNKATESLNKASEKAASLQTELIAVLSIFAAIVTLFSGSLSFISSALSGMINTPILKTTFYILLCGMVVFNSIFLLMYLVGKLTNRNIYANCESIDCTCNNGRPKCGSVNRLRKRLPYIFWFNVVLIILMGVDFILWVIKLQWGN